MIMKNSLATTMIVISIRMSMIRVINLHRFDCVSEVCVCGPKNKKGGMVGGYERRWEGRELES